MSPSITRHGSPSNTRLLQKLQSKMRLRHYSLRTEQAYAGWVVRFVRFHQLRHPLEMGEREVAAFLTWLAEERRVAVSTQVQAQAALVYLYREVLAEMRSFLLPPILQLDGRAS